MVGIGMRLVLPAEQVGNDTNPDLVGMQEVRCLGG